MIKLLKGTSPLGRTVTAIAKGTRFTHLCLGRPNSGDYQAAYMMAVKRFPDLTGSPYEVTNATE